MASVVDADLPQRRMTQEEIIASVARPNPVRMKIISMGEENTGKSCLIKRYCEERFIPKYLATIGVDYGVKRVMIDDREVRIGFWDLAGSPDYAQVRQEFYKDAEGAVLVYDVGNQRSFLALETWLRESAKNGAKDLVCAVCANKVDDTSAKRQVSEAEGRKWALSKGFSYFETSAATGANVAAMFDQLFEDTLLLKKA